MVQPKKMSLSLKDDSSAKSDKKDIIEEKKTIKKKELIPSDEEFFKTPENLASKRIKVSYYFKTKVLTNPDAELFYGNGITLHKLRLTDHARYFNTFSMIKMFMFEPVYVTLQMMPLFQITLLTGIQLVFTLWIAYCGFSKKIFDSKISFFSNLIAESAVLAFLIIGFSFVVKGGVKKFDTNTSSAMQMVAVLFILISCIVGLVDLVATIIQLIKKSKLDKKVNAYVEKLNKRKEEQNLVRQKIIERPTMKRNLLDKPDEVGQNGVNHDLLSTPKVDITTEKRSSISTKVPTISNKPSLDI